MDVIQVRTFATVSRPFAPVKRRKQIARLLVGRKFGLGASELAKAHKRRERKAAAAEAEGGGLVDGDGNGLGSDDDDDDDEDLLEEADVRGSELEATHAEALLETLRARQGALREHKKQLMAVLKQVLKEDGSRKASAVKAVAEMQAGGGTGAGAGAGAVAQRNGPPPLPLQGLRSPSGVMQQRVPRPGAPMSPRPPMRAASSGGGIVSPFIPQSLSAFNASPRVPFVPPNFPRGPPPPTSGPPPNQRAAHD